MGQSQQFTFAGQHLLMKEFPTLERSAHFYLLHPLGYLHIPP